MQRVLKSLLVLLLVVALGVAATGTATALPWAGHHAEMTSFNQLYSDWRKEAAEAIANATHRHETDGKCLHPCCTAPAIAALPEIIRPYVALRVMPAGFAVPCDYLLSGIDVTPLTGPPKLSA